MDFRVWQWGLWGMTTLSLVLNTVPVNAQAPEQPTVTPDETTFFCRDITDPASNQKVKATLVWSPELQGNVRVIAWKSEYFSRFGWNPEKRCQEVTKKFNTLFQQGQLNYLATGEVNGYPIICGLADLEDHCKSDSQLFQLKPNDNADQVLQDISGTLSGNTGNLSHQNSKNSRNEFRLPIKGLLNRDNILKESDSPKCTVTTGPQATNAALDCR